MSTEIRKVAVLGAGVMGSGIAAHLANAGIGSLLFDLERPREAVAGLAKVKPAPLFSAEAARLIEPCSFAQDIGRLSEVQWVVEAVTERLDIKRKVFAQVIENTSDETIVTSNTSGIPIAQMVEGTDAGFRRRFFVTHFFNPVRYMKLLELVAGEETDPALVERLATFGDRVLGKGIVYGKDTVNFVANRIGTYGMMRIMHRMREAGLNVSQVDKIFGKPMGRPKSAVFRTADVVGLDTLTHVAENCHQNLGHDACRDAFEIPSYLRQMLDQGLLGQKSGAGFYKKTKGADGKRVIQVLNLETLEYEDPQSVRFESLGKVKGISDPGDRVKALLAHGDQASNFAWKATADTLLYSASLLGEIADDVVNVDRALRWGFAWDQGPFELWDALGVQETCERMQADGMTVPPVALAAARAGGWYSRRDGVTSYLDVCGDQERKPVPQLAGGLSIRDRKEAGGVVAKNSSATLVDLGDNVLGIEFHSKMNALDGDIIKLYGQALDRLDSDWDALVVGNQATNFSAGANIMMVLMASAQKAWDQIDALTSGLQGVLMRAKYHPKPVVTAPHGLTLGGGAEVAMHGAASRAAGELYMGLVEVGVGLLPAGGGCKELLWRTVGSVPHGVQVDPFPFVQKCFEQIGMGKVATSAGEARQMAMLRPSDSISMNTERLLADAKQVALGLARAGYTPPVRRKIRLPGTNGSAALRAGIWGFVQAGQISEYDALIGNKIAHVLCGGNIAPGTAVSEEAILELEREAFVSLCGEKKTQERIEHMLRTGKPLRN